MRTVYLICLSMILAATLCAQNAEFPEILNPAATTQAEAKRLDARALKLLPRGMFPAKIPEPSYKDDENPLGIREGGSYYSFTTASHSYNRTPQIGLEKDSLHAGSFYGYNYGFLKDLGRISLLEVTSDMPELVFLLDYKPPHFDADIRSEQAKRGDYRANGFVYRSSVVYDAGHTYALRAIGYREADILVALTVLNKNDDGSLEIVWKTLKTFEKPEVWYYTNADLDLKVSHIMRDARFTGVRFTARDNVVRLSGTTTPQVKQDLIRLLAGSLRTVTIVSEISEMETSKNP